MPKILADDNLASLAMSRLHIAKSHRDTHQIYQGRTIAQWFEIAAQDYAKVYSDAIRKAHPDIYGFFGLTNLKVDACTSHLMAKYAHALDAPFVFEISQNPELNDDDNMWVNQQTERRLTVTMNETGLSYAAPGTSTSVFERPNIFKPAVRQFIEQQKKELRENYREVAIKKSQEAAVYSQNFVKDQLMNPQSGWDVAPIQLIKNMLLYPYAAMAGNEYKSVSGTVWDKGSIKYITETIPTWRNIDPWNLYIAPDARHAQVGSYAIEVVKRTRKELADILHCEDNYGYKKPAIKSMLEAYSSSTNWVGEKPLQNNSQFDDKDTFTCVVFQGLLSQSELTSYNVTGYGNAKDRFVNVAIEVVGNTTIRLEVIKTPNNARNYYSASFNGSEGYAGQSIAMKLHERQVEINLLMYAKGQNQWQSSGANLFVNGQYFDDLADFKLEPHSATLMRATETGSAGRPFDSYQTQPMFRMMTAEIRELMILADEECGIPSVISGVTRQGAASQPLGTTVIQKSAGEAALDAATKLLDKTVLEPMFTQLHLANLQDNKIPAQYRRGDLQIVGRGIYGLAREQERQMMMANMRPQLDADVQRGIVPKEMYADSVKSMYAAGGFDVSAMQGGAASEELRQSNLPKADGRTYTPPQQNLGVTQ